jgi:hypothetical protein
MGFFEDSGGGLITMNSLLRIIVGENELNYLGNSD